MIVLEKQTSKLKENKWDLYVDEHSFCKIAGCIKHICIDSPIVVRNLKLQQHRAQSVTSETTPIS